MVQGKWHLESLSSTPSNPAQQPPHVANDIAESKTSGTIGYTVTDAGPMPHMGVLSLRETLKQMSTTETAAISIVAIVMIVSLLICTCIGALSIAYPDKFPFWGERRYAPTDDEEVVVPALQQRQLQLDRKYPSPPGTFAGYLPSWSPFSTSASLTSPALMS